MKNLMNFKALFLYSFCLAGPMFFASSCSENKRTDSQEVAKQENMKRLTSNDNAAVVIENDNDAKFLMKAAEIEHELISLGKLAQEKGNNTEVKDFGKMIETDHNKTLTEIRTLAQSKSISIPTSITDDSKNHWDDLNKRTGNDFGKSYSKMMVDRHEDAIDLYEEVIEDTEDPEIRAWASKRLSALRTHHERAKEFKKNTDNLKS